MQVLKLNDIIINGYYIYNFTPVEEQKPEMQPLHCKSLTEQLACGLHCWPLIVTVNHTSRWDSDNTLSDLGAEARITSTKQERNSQNPRFYKDHDLSIGLLLI